MTQNEPKKLIVKKVLTLTKEQLLNILKINKNAIITTSLISGPPYDPLIEVRDITTINIYWEEND